MSGKALDYSSREYDDLLRQARRIGWNDDEVSSEERKKQQDDFDRSLDQRFDSSDENVQRIKRAARVDY